MPPKRSKNGVVPGSQTTMWKWVKVSAVEDSKQVIEQGLPSMDASDSGQAYGNLVIELTNGAESICRHVGDEACSNRGNLSVVEVQKEIGKSHPISNGMSNENDVDIDDLEEAADNLAPSPEPEGDCRTSELDDEDLNASSSYEKLRLANIAKNEAFLASLGLGDSVRVFQQNPSTSKRKSRPRPKKNRDAPRRMSARLNKSIEIPADQTLNDTRPHESEFPQHFDESLVFHARESYSDVNCPEKPENKFSEPNLVHSWSDLSMKKIYSMDVGERLFVAGGQGGQVGIFGIPSFDSGPLMSFKASRGWISSVRFCCESSSAKGLLLTASNDGSLSLWNTDKEERSSHRPLLVYETNNIHRSGIFSMHSKADLVLTGGKDHMVVLSKIHPDGSILELYSCGDHEGVAKSVHFRDENLAASTGNDRKLNIIDVRAKKTQLSIENAHELAVNSVRWNPIENEMQCITASFSPEIRLWDIRKPSQFAAEFKSHTPAFVSRCKSIYHPVFVQGGRMLTTSSDAETYITVYDVSSTLVLGRFDAGFQPTTLAVVGNDVLAAGTSKIHQLTYTVDEVT